MAIAAGIPCNVDPLLYNIVKAQNHCGKGLSEICNVDPHLYDVVKAQNERHTLYCVYW